MDIETKEMLQLILSKVTLLEQDVSGLKQDVSSLKQGQERLEQGQRDIKQHITNNNVAIDDIVTGIMERADTRVNSIEKVTKENLYDIALLKVKSK